MEEFGDEETESGQPQAKVAVFDLDEDGIDSLEQFGMTKHAV